MREWLGRDLKLALRSLRRERAFSLVAMLSIGLGVGANAAIFSLVDQTLYRRLPVREQLRACPGSSRGTLPVRRLSRCRRLATAAASRCHLHLRPGWYLCHCLLP